MLLCLPTHRATTVFAILLLLAHLASAGFGYGTCCKNANSEAILYFRDEQQIFQPLLTNYTTCGQQYDVDIDPAPDVYIRYHDCKSSCKGFALAKANNPDTWAAPVVQFILPSIIFSMSIPRRTLFVPSCHFGRGLLPSAVNAIFGLILATLDTILRVAIILTLAGPLMVSGLTEAVLDIRILAACSSTKYLTLNDSTRLRLITTVVCGNIQLEDNEPAEEIPKALESLPASRLTEALLGLMSAQGDFGALVGAPVIFYMGGFVYTILDLLTDPSAQAAAISLAFGVNWMMVVHVAIISGCLLASNNPSAVSVLAGTRTLQPISTKWYQPPLVYNTAFQPVSMWRRGANKKLWLKSITTKNGDVEQNKVLADIRHDVRIGFWGYLCCIFIPTLILISLPPVAGAVVAWRTPPIGWGCRSLTLIIYAACQLVMILLQELRHYVYHMPKVFPWTNSQPHNSLFQNLAQRLLSILEISYRYSLDLHHLILCFLSVFTALGGTVMQTTGVYGNCFCYVNSQMWFRLDEAFVNVASDTYDQRHSSKNWITMGSVATGFMVVCSYFGWWYQKKIREEYRRRVEGLLI